MKKNILLILLFVTISKSFAQSQLFTIVKDSAILRKENDLLIRDFEQRVKKVDSNISFKGLKTIVRDSLFAGYYLPRTNRIYLPRWETIPQPIIDFCTKVSGSRKEGENLAAMYFYGFFLPHEIAHGLQYNTNILKDNEYDNEYQASEMALLYWKARGKEKELAACYAIAKKVLSNLKNPIPANADMKKYFTEHYEEMAQDADQYGYMMFSQIVSIFEDKNLPDFDTYIKRFLAK